MTDDIYIDNSISDDNSISHNHDDNIINNNNISISNSSNDNISQPVTNNSNNSNNSIKLIEPTIAHGNLTRSTPKIKTGPNRILPTRLNSSTSSNTVSNFRSSPSFTPRRVTPRRVTPNVSLRKSPLRIINNTIDPKDVDIKQLNNNLNDAIVNNPVKPEVKRPLISPDKVIHPTKRSPVPTDDTKSNFNGVEFDDSNIVSIKPLNNLKNDHVNKLVDSFDEFAHERTTNINNTDITEGFTDITEVTEGFTDDEEVTDVSKVAKVTKVTKVNNVIDPNEEIINSAPPITKLSFKESNESSKNESLKSLKNESTESLKSLESNNIPNYDDMSKDKQNKHRHNFIARLKEIGRRHPNITIPDITTATSLYTLHNIFDNISKQVYDKSHKSNKSSNDNLQIMQPQLKSNKIYVSKAVEDKTSTSSNPLQNTNLTSSKTTTSPTSSKSSTPLQNIVLRQPVPKQHTNSVQPKQHINPVQNIGLRQPQPKQHINPVQNTGLRQPQPKQHTNPIQNTGLRQPQPKQHINQNTGLRQPQPKQRYVDSNSSHQQNQESYQQYSENAQQNFQPAQNVQPAQRFEQIDPNYVTQDINDQIPLNDNLNISYLPAKVLPKFNIPNYSGMPEVEQIQHRANFDQMFAILRRRKPELNIRMIPHDMPLEHIHAMYESYVRPLHVNKNVGKYQFFLVVGWLLLEAAGTYYGLDIEGYTTSQMSSMDDYNSILTELGEDSYRHEATIMINEPKQSAFWRLFYIIVFNIAAFMVVKLISKFISLPQASIQYILNAIIIMLSGDVITSTNTNPGVTTNVTALPDNENPVQDIVTGLVGADNPLAGMLSNIDPTQLLLQMGPQLINSFLGNFLNNTNNNVQARQTSTSVPQYHPAYPE